MGDRAGPLQHPRHLAPPDRRQHADERRPGRAGGRDAAARSPSARPATCCRCRGSSRRTWPPPWSSWRPIAPASSPARNSSSTPGCSLAEGTRLPKIAGAENSSRCPRRRPQLALTDGRGVAMPPVRNSITSANDGGCGRRPSPKPFHGGEGPPGKTLTTEPVRGLPPVRYAPDGGVTRREQEDDMGRTAAVFLVLMAVGGCVSDDQGQVAQFTPTMKPASPAAPSYSTWSRSPEQFAALQDGPTAPPAHARRRRRPARRRTARRRRSPPWP